MATAEQVANDPQVQDHPTGWRRYLYSTMSLGAVFSIFAGWYYWFPKITGYMYSETPRKLHFWLTLVGVNLAFFPMHFLGLSGMARRIADYPDAFAGMNEIGSIAFPRSA